MKPHLYIFGDSYLDGIHKTSQGKILTDFFTVHNFALRSSSEFRIFNTFLTNKKVFKENYYCVIGHTFPIRLYVPNKPRDITGYDRIETIYKKDHKEFYYDLVTPKHYFDFVYKSIGTSYDDVLMHANVLHFYWHNNPNYICKSGTAIHINQIDKNYEINIAGRNHMSDITINKLLLFIQRYFLND